MNNPGGMSGLESLSDLLGDWQRLRHWQRTLDQEFGQSQPLHEFKDQCLDVARLFDAMKSGDVGMVQRGEHPRLAFESDETIGIAGKGVGQDFERHLSPKSHIAGAIHLAHSTGTDETYNLVLSECGTRESVIAERRLPGAAHCSRTCTRQALPLEAPA